MIVALVADLIFDSRITGAARRVGVEVQAVRSPDALLGASSNARLVIVDLSAAGDHPPELIRKLKAAAPQARVVAFLAHVEVELRKAALAAGADEVLPRSAFVERLEALLRESQAG
ncbi:MAG: DNA-binding response regulator [Planctomycetota bacterium]|nr:MAG: DNA-binding response regulator [Planctomycetota bacterium]